MNLSLLDHDLLTASRETELLERIRVSTRVVMHNRRKEFLCTDNDAQDELLRHNERLIYSIAEKYLSISAADTEIDDLMQEGRRGLLRAACKWDTQIAEDRGVNKFSTYASFWIVQCVRRYALRHRSGLSRSYSMDEFDLQVRKMIDTLTKTFERTPTAEEIAERGGFDLGRVKQILEAPAIVAMDDASRRLDQIADRDALTADDIEAGLTAHASLAYLEQDHPRMAQILRMRFGLNGHGETPMSMSQVARELGVTRQKIDQLEKEALRILREREMS